MQLIQPKVKELQKKYGHDREKLAQETMALYSESGTNPFASCLPLMLQLPIFFALFRLLDQAAKNNKANGVLTPRTRPRAFRTAPPCSGSRSSARRQQRRDTQRPDPGRVPGGGDDGDTFMTQRQLMAKNMPADAMSGPYAQQQKMLLYVLPVVFAVGGIAFPIGVLFYWTPRTCGPWASSSMSSAGTRRRVRRRTPPSRDAIAPRAAKVTEVPRGGGPRGGGEAGAASAAPAAQEADPRAATPGGRQPRPQA